MVAATHRDLLKLAKDGKFRDDLYYRLNVVKVDLPPLQERTEDIPLLAEHFVQKFRRLNRCAKQISPEAMEAMLQYRWPGNIRELENAIERACVTSRSELIAPENLPPEIVKPSGPRSQLQVDLSRPLADQVAELTAAFEERYLRMALKKDTRPRRPDRRPHRAVAADDHRKAGPLSDRQGRIQARLTASRAERRRTRVGNHVGRI